MAPESIHRCKLYRDSRRLVVEPLEQRRLLNATWSGPLPVADADYADVWSESATTIQAMLATGDLTATVEDAAGLPAVGASVLLYDDLWNLIAEGTTDAAGQSTWIGLDPAGYNLEVYRDGEYWGNTAIDVIADQTTQTTFRRNEPRIMDFRALDLRRFDVTGTTVAPGSWLAYEIDVANDVSEGREVLVTLLVDRNGVAPYDFEPVAKWQGLGAASTTTVAFNDIVDELGTHQWRVDVQTLVQEQWVVTDSSSWQTAVNVEAPGLLVTVEDQTGVTVDGAAVALYDGLWNFVGQKNTDTDGQAAWLGLNPGTYHIEAYYHGEYWGNDTVDVPADQFVPWTLPRMEPYAGDFRVLDEDGHNITEGVEGVGATLTYEIDVTNDTDGERDVRVTLWVDRDQTAPDDFASTPVTQTLPLGTTGTFSFTDTVDELGTHQRRLIVETRENTGWAVSDSWAWGTAVTIEEVSAPRWEFFDDFSYIDSADPSLGEFGWGMRSGNTGGAGSGQWDSGHVQFVTDLDDASNRLLRMVANVDDAGATQSEIATTDARFYEGTYAARVYLTDTAMSAVGGDGTVQAFFTISDTNLGADYSECDFEYLPAGSWTGPAAEPRMTVTTWDFYDEVPGSSPAEAQTAERVGSLADGWHTLVLHVLDGEVGYYIDGESVLAEPHGGDYFPESPMRLAFQNWVVWLTTSTQTRQYAWDVDWVYHAKDVAIPAWEVGRIVDRTRGEGLARKDTMDLPVVIGLSGSGSPVPGVNNDVIETDDLVLVDTPALELVWHPGDVGDGLFGGIYTIATYSGSLSGTFAAPVLKVADNGTDASAYIDTTYGTGGIDYGSGTNDAVTVKLKYLLPGDANLDGDVDVFQIDGKGDAQVLSSNLGTTNGATWTDGDFNLDGDVDVFQIDGKGDAQLLSSNLGTSLDIALEQAVMEEQDTAEPLSAALDWQAELQSARSKRAKRKDVEATVDQLLATEWA